MFYFIAIVSAFVVGVIFGYGYQLGTVDRIREHYRKIINQMKQNVNVVIQKVPFCPCQKPAQQKLNHDGKEHYLCNGCISEFLSKIGEG